MRKCRFAAVFVALALLLPFLCGAADAGTRTVAMDELSVSFALPSGWTESHEFAYRSFWSAERDRELNFWRLEAEGKNLEALYELAMAEHADRPLAFRNLERACVGGHDCLTFLDEIGQFCAYYALGENRILYVSLTDNGTGRDVFDAILSSIVFFERTGETTATETTAAVLLERAGAVEPTPFSALERAATPTPEPTPIPTPRPTSAPADEPASRDSDFDFSRCGVCNGTGRCYPCHGVGWRYAHGDRVTCAACKGSGECRSCGGDGKK